MNSIRKKVLMTDFKRRICELDAESIAYYRRNPCLASEDLLGIKLIDSQKYILQQSWNVPHCVWCCSRNFGKSFIGAVFMLLKAILYENQAIYIVSSVGTQSKETFAKIEEIVLRIGKTAASIKSLKDIVAKETKKSGNNKTGFSHDPSGYSVSFYNGSEIFTLNGNPDNNRSKTKNNVFIMKNKSSMEEIIMSRKTWTDQDITFIKENYGVLAPEEISESMERTYSSITHKASREHIVPQFKWSDEEIKLLENNYKNMTYRELSELLPGRTKTAIDLKINKLGLHKEKYTYNKRFFQCIDAEEKAYWLGFIYADGCVFVNEDTNSGEVAIKLFSGDYKHLKKFNRAIGGNIPVTFEERICSLNGKPASSCIIRCFSIDMANDLIKVGCIPNKTFFVQMPDINESLMNHFIRGFFDGDGCICRCSKKRNTLSIDFCSASLVFLEQLRAVLFSQGINSYIVDEKGRNTFRLYVKGVKNTDNMWNYMFEGATTYLERKFVKKTALYEEYDIAQRLLRLSEMTG